MSFSYFYVSETIRITGYSIASEDDLYCQRREKDIVTKEGSDGKYSCLAGAEKAVAACRADSNNIRRYQRRQRPLSFLPLCATSFAHHHITNSPSKRLAHYTAVDFQHG